MARNAGRCYVSCSLVVRLVTNTIKQIDRPSKAPLLEPCDAHRVKVHAGQAEAVWHAITILAYIGSVVTRIHKNAKVPILANISSIFIAQIADFALAPCTQE